MTEKEAVKEILRQALDADENGDKDAAVELYTKAVETILKIGDPVLRERLNKYAVQSLDRAEELRGISSPKRTTTQTTNVDETSPNNRVQNTNTTRLDHENKPVPKPRVVPAASGSSSGGYTEDEKRVLNHTSNVNDNIFVPFMDVDLKERFVYPIPFNDKDGMLELAPKQKRDFIEWRRVSELCENPKLIVGDSVDYHSIKQTVISDCSFVASLAVSALYERRFGRALVTSIIYPRNSRNEPIYNSSGKYSIKLHINGIPRKVLIDDYLPIGRYNQLLCSYSNNKNEFWVSLLEKAYMKVMGGYDFPGSNSNIDLHALTGWIPERIAMHQKDTTFDADAAFDRLESGLEHGRCLLTVATGELSDDHAERTGLVPAHAYAVLNMKEVNGVKLLQLKNPWSHLRWKGNYSELDTVHWTPELQEQLNYNPKLAEQYDNGIFWIDYPSIFNFFDVFYVNWDPNLFHHTYCIHASWNAGVGPTKDAYTIGDNPQFNLRVGAGQGSVWVLLTRHITSIEDFRENHEYITLLVYQNGGKRIYYPYDPPPYIDGVRINSPHYLCKIRLDPSQEKNYTLVVSQYEKTTTIYYTLRAYSRSPFEFKAIPCKFVGKQRINGEWKGPRAGGCQNHQATYRNNPRYSLKIGPKEQNNLVIELRGPKVYQVGFEIVVVSLDDPNLTAPFVSKVTGNYRSGYCVLDLNDIPAGTYHLIPSTYLPGQESPFILDVKATTNISLELIN